MKYRLEITCDNAAFSDDFGISTYSAYPEVARILRSAAAAINRGEDAVLLDINGNTVGTAGFEK